MNNCTETKFKQNFLSRILVTSKKQLIMNLVGSYRKLPDSVVGQICRIIGELSDTLDPSSSNFFFGLLREQSGSIFVKREIINLVRLRSEVADTEILKMIENILPWMRNSFPPGLRDSTRKKVPPPIQFSIPIRNFFDLKPSVYFFIKNHRKRL